MIAPLFERAKTERFPINEVIEFDLKAAHAVTTEVFARDGFAESEPSTIALDAVPVPSASRSTR